jgi:F-box/leucine-rich repeat protein 2/20
MQAPSRLASHLVSYISCKTDRELFSTLIHHPDDLFLFFAAACEDEKWLLHHSFFIRLALRWLAKQFYLEKISSDDAHRAAQIIQSHFPLLQPFLFFRAAFFFTIQLRVEDQTILVNSFLFGVGSPFLKNIFKQECYEKLRNEWNFLSVRRPIFQFIATYLYKGYIADLGTYSHKDRVDLLAQAQRWELHDLVDEINRRNCL